MKTGAVVKDGGETKTWREIAPFALLSAVSFLGCVGLLLLILRYATVLVSLGLVGNFYYVVAVALGLSAAAFLFGVFRSYAYYKGKVLNGTLELGGPVVLFVLVVIGAFKLPKPPEAFSVTVFVHGESGPHDLVLRNSGTVWMTLDPDLRQEKIGDKGQAEFKNIPEKFRAQKVALSVEADGFEMSGPEKRYALKGDSVSVSVRRKAIRVSGTIMDTQGLAVANATLRSGEVQTVADGAGHFSFTLSGDQILQEIHAEVTAPGFETWRGRLVPNAGDAQIQMQPSR